MDDISIGIKNDMFADMRDTSNSFDLERKYLYTRRVLRGDMDCLGSYGFISWHAILMNKEDCIEVLRRCGR